MVTIVTNCKDRCIIYAYFKTNIALSSNQINQLVTMYLLHVTIVSTNRRMDRYNWYIRYLLLCLETSRTIIKHTCN